MSPQFWASEPSADKDLITSGWERVEKGNRNETPDVCGEGNGRIRGGNSLGNLLVHSFLEVYLVLETHSVVFRKLFLAQGTVVTPGGTHRHGARD